MTAPLLDSPPSLSAHAPQLPPGAEEHWMLVGGSRMRYLRAGSGSPLILVHGLLGYSFSWRFTMPALAPYATVYAVDMLGTGFSDHPQGLDCCMSAAADRLLQFVEQLGLGSFDLLGTSHGGAVSVLAAAQSLRENRRPRPQRLILVAPVNPYSAHGQWLAPFFGTPLGSWVFRSTLAKWKFLYRPILERLYGDPRMISPGTLEGYCAPAERPSYFQYGLDICRSWTDDLKKVEHALPLIGRIPTLLMWGNKDVAVYSSSAQQLAQHFANSKLIVFPGVGHLPYEERPEEFNRALIDFLRSTPV